MNYIRWYIPVILSILLGCGPKEAVIRSAPPANYSVGWWGEVTGTRNSVPMWNPRIRGELFPYKQRQECDKDMFYMQITEYDNSGCERLSLTFQGVPRRVGVSDTLQHGFLFERCQPRSYPHVGLVFLECDARFGDYVVDSTRQSQLTIRSFDAISGEVSGSFKIHFFAHTKPSPLIIDNPQDRIYYEAEFKAKLLQEGQTGYQ